MRFKRLIIAACFLLLASIGGKSQSGIRGQIFMPNGAPAQRQIRFMLTTDNGMRRELYYTDSNGRIAIPALNTPYTITVESDKETYDTTSQSFIPIHAGSYILIHLRPLTSTPSQPPGLVNVTDIDQNVSPKAKEAYEQALKLLREGNYERAIEPLKRAVSIQSNYFHAYADLGVAYLNLNKLEEAINALQRAIKINDKVYIPQLNLAIVFNRQAKYKEAVELLTKLQRNNPELWKIHAPLVEALIGAHEWAKAEEAITKAITLKDVDAVDLKIKLGMVRIRQAKYTEALVPLREATTAEPDNALAQFNLGAATLQAGNLDESEQALRRAYQIQGPSMAGAQLLLGQVYFKKNDYPKAIEAFETYLRDLPNAPNAEQVKESIQKLRQALPRN